MSILQKMYPEAGCGGFTRVDGTVEFYGRVNALLRPQMTVLNFGAGRGADILEDPVEYRRKLQSLKGKVHKVIGVDIDPIVMTNPDLDEAHVVTTGALLPLSNSSVDLVLSDCVFEHVEQPEHVARELSRVLKVGGWICARTPNRWGYAGIATNLVPNAMHLRFLRYLQPGRKTEDVFPTRYRMNTHFQLRRLFPLSSFEHFTYTMNGEPAYFGNSEIAWRTMMLLFRFIPASLGAALFVFLRKRESI